MLPFEKYLQVNPLYASHISYPSREPRAEICQCLDIELYQ